MFEGLPMSSERRRRRVLIVEDEPALRLSYERHFNPRYDLVFASTGAEALAKIPLGRPGRPDEIAGPVAFLVSDLASYMYGEVLAVNGGAVMAG